MSDLRRIIWLASYPKSGNTWMRSLLAHYLMPPGTAPDINNLRQFTTADVRQDFFDLAAGQPFRGQSVDDWVAVRGKALRLIAGSKPNQHFVKTHCQPIVLLGEPLIPAEFTAAAIYILRNPFDVAPSYARHASADLDTAIDRMLFPDNMMGTPTGIYDALGRWDDHVKAWTEAPGLPLHVVRYEDLIEKPAKAMRALLKDFLKVPIDQPKLARAIKSTSFANMKKQEETKGFREKPEGMQSFFAKGKVGAWREDLTKEQIARLRDEFAPALERWYPEVLRDVDRFLKTAC
jgi:hypothetical protein